jgi:hypothetical protein
LIDALEKDYVGDVCKDEDPAEAVALGTDGKPSALTFGMIYDAQKLLRALPPGPASGEYVVVPAKPIGWFNPWNDYHGFQQVAEEFEGDGETIPLYADQKTHDDLKTAMLNAASRTGGGK